MARKPSKLTYGVEDRPPLASAAVLALQHAGLALMFMIYPVVAAQEIGLDATGVTTMVTASIVGIGLATLLQSFRPPIGSGQLAVHIPTPVLLPATIHVGLLAGPGAVAFMTVSVGILELAFARILRHLRTVFPAEVCGVVVLMLGISLVEPGLSRFGDLSAHEPHVIPDRRDFAVALATLSLMIAIAIFGHRRLKLFALAIGCIGGSLLAAFFGLFDDTLTARIAEAPVLGLPSLALPAWRIEMALLPLILLLTVVNSVDNLGVLVSIERMNDADWKRADMARGACGVQANGVGNIASGALGGMGMGISSSHVGFAFGTGVTARFVGIVAGSLILAAAFFPKLAVTLSLMPAPVIGAIMIYAAAFIIVSGMDLILSRMLSERRIFTVGLATILGLSVLVRPQFFSDAPAWMEPLLSSELAVAAIVAIALNLLFRVGTRQWATCVVSADVNPYETARTFLDRQGDLWGARRDAMQRALHVTVEALEALRDNPSVQGDIVVTAHFDEFNLDIDLVYDGPPLTIHAAPPTLSELADDDDAMDRMPGYLIGRLATRAILAEVDGRQKLTLHFEH